MNTKEIKALAIRHADIENAKADRVLAVIPAMEYETQRLYEGLLTAELTGGLTERMAQNKWKASKARLENRQAQELHHRNRATDLHHYMRHISWRAFKNRSYMMDLPVFRLPKDGKAKGTDPENGKAMMMAAEGKTMFDKPYAYTMGLTAVGYTTDTTYAVNGSGRAADRATGHTKSRGRQIHGPEQTGAGLRLCLQSDYFFWKVSEYHRKCITRPAGKDKDGNPKRRVISRPAYDKAAGYVTDIPTAIKRLRAIQTVISDPVEYPGNDWALTDRPKYNSDQIDRMISDLTAIGKGRHSDRFTQAQMTPADLYGYGPLQSRIKALLDKDITITKLGQWSYWNTKVIQAMKPVDGPADVMAPTETGEDWDPTLGPDTVTVPLTHREKGPWGMSRDDYRPSKPRTHGDTPPRVKRAKNGRIMVDGRFVSNAPISTPKSAGDGQALADNLRTERFDRWDDWWNVNGKQPHSPTP